MALSKSEHFLALLPRHFEHFPRLEVVVSRGQVVLQEPEGRGLELALVGRQAYPGRNRVFELFDGGGQAVLHGNGFRAAADPQAPLGRGTGVRFQRQLQLQRRPFGDARRPRFGRHQARRRVHAGLLRGGAVVVVASST